MRDNQLTIALSKGRILEESLRLLGRIGIEPVDDLEASRRLVVASNQPGVKLIIVRAIDVPTYVEFGAADLGVAGRDILLEQEVDLYEPVDLGIGQCRLVVAKPQALVVEGHSSSWKGVRIATKYPRITGRFLAEKGVQPQIVKLYGSMELAPLVGLADRIVDLVSTGRTLEENGLVELETLCPISSRLVVNKAALKLKHSRISQLIDQMAEAVAAEAPVG